MHGRLTRNGRFQSGTGPKNVGGADLLGKMSKGVCPYSPLVNIGQKGAFADVTPNPVFALQHLKCTPQLGTVQAKVRTQNPFRWKPLSRFEGPVDDISPQLCQRRTARNTMLR